MAEWQRAPKTGALHTMKPTDTNQDTERNVIDATSKFRAERPRLKALKNPPLEPEEAKVLDRYIAPAGESRPARRRPMHSRARC
jgi:hypothetical protein